MALELLIIYYWMKIFLIFLIFQVLYQSGISINYAMVAFLMKFFSIRFQNIICAVGLISHHLFLKLA